MNTEYSNKCDKCKSIGKETHARRYFKKIDNKWLYLCYGCWTLLNEVICSEQT